MSLYETLGVDKTASIDQIKQAYRKQARKAHPDAGGDAETFKSLALANDVLTDPEKRKHYDATGQTQKDDNKLQMAAAHFIQQAFCGEKDLDDPIRWICDQIDHRRSECRASKSKAERTAEKIKKRIERFEKANQKTKNEAARDFVINCMNLQVEKLAQQIESDRLDIELGNELMAFFNDIKSGAAPMPRGPLSQDILYRPHWSTFTS